MAPDEAGAWRNEIVERWQINEQIALLGFTNFAWHYRGDERTQPIPPEILLSVPTVSARPLRNPGSLRCLQIVFNTYGVAANEY
jgi:hypothetical protein